MKILLDEEQLHRGVSQLADAVTRIYGKEPITIVAVMTGSLVLLADLIRRLEMPVRVGLIQASSYRGGMVSGTLTVNDQMMLDVRDRDVLLLDDIFDTGKTLKQIAEHLSAMGAKSLRTAVLLRNREHKRWLSNPTL